MSEEGPTRNKKIGILKYFFVEISFEKSAIIQGPTTRVSDALGQKLGYDSYLFLVDISVSKFISAYLSTLYNNE